MLQAHQTDDRLVQARDDSLQVRPDSLVMLTGVILYLQIPRSVGDHVLWSGCLSQTKQIFSCRSVHVKQLNSPVPLKNLL